MVDDAAFWLEELELARAGLARGDLAWVTGQMPELARGAARYPDHRIVQDALASLRTHLALAAGDLEGAARAAETGVDEERRVVAALLAAARGETPPRGLVRRWGLALSVTLVAAWRQGDHETARRALGAELERAPVQAAVGSVRALAVAARLGVSPGSVLGRSLGPRRGGAGSRRAARAGPRSCAACAGSTRPAWWRPWTVSSGAGTDALATSHLAALARALWACRGWGFATAASAWGSGESRSGRPRRSRRAPCGSPAGRPSRRWSWPCCALLARHLAAQRAQPGRRVPCRPGACSASALPSRWCASTSPSGRHCRSRC